MRAGRRRLTADGMWTWRRIIGETVAATATGAVAAVGLSEFGGPGVVLGAATAGTLCVARRVLPASVLVASSALAGLVGGFWLLMPLAGWSAGGRVAAARRVVAAFAVSYVAHASLAVGLWWRGAPDPRTLLLLTVGFVASTVLPGLVSRYRAQRRALLDALHEHNEQLLREREMIASHWRLRERQRIAQDMHDSIGHRLALITVQTGALEVDSGLTDEQRSRVGQLRESAAGAMHELREVVGVLHEDGSGGDRPAGTHPARGVAGVADLVAAARRAGATVELRRTGVARALDPAADHAAYRIAQEALTNALKHAPGARVVVELRYEPDAFVAEVADTGATGPAGGDAHDPVGGGQGLTGLRERARLVGGLLHSGPTGDGGFRVAGMLPYGTGRDTADTTGAAEASHGPTVPAAADRPPPRAAATGGTVDGARGAFDWQAPHQRQQELTTAMRRNWRGVAIGCGTATLCAAVLVALGLWALREWDASLLSPEAYAAVEVGADEAEVRAGLPEGSFLFEDVAGPEPPRPPGAECVVRGSTEQPDDPALVALFRFCFADGRLARKDAFTTEL